MSATKTNQPTASRGRPAASGERRDEILAAALTCFVADGFHGTAVPQVAKQAGIATGTIYHYFPSKEAMVNALYRKWKEAIGRRVFTAFPPAAHVREQFRAVWHEMVDFALAEPDAFAFLELHNHRSYLDAESLAMENRLKDFAALMVQTAQKRGEIKAGPTSLLMELVFGAVTGMMRAHWDGRFELTADTRRVAEQACWDTIAASPG
ncbi:MAG: TetR/AcrR family transcriptional regulator [Myxococcales bacterium]|nr:TetR/AcrR family transcriptional regulator [Myxococcales bacterium]MCB9733710.1 TetR/AcrR family transcriptional regulator [Deltaproteobacteria bacterium]